MRLHAKSTLFATALILAVSVMGCPPPEVPTPPVPDAGQDVEQPDVVELECSTPATCVCARRLQLGCEGSEDLDTCVVVTTDIIRERIIPFDPECIIAATTKEAVRRCPGVKCR
jgi:hypothetical protein